MSNLLRLFDNYDASPLSEASINGHIDIMKILLEYDNIGLNPNS